MTRFDPAAHNVVEVLAYLDAVQDSPREVGRVLAAERIGLARPEILTQFSPQAGGRPQLEEEP